MEDSLLNEKLLRLQENMNGKLDLVLLQLKQMKEMYDKHEERIKTLEDIPKHDFKTCPNTQKIRRTEIDITEMKKKLTKILEDTEELRIIKKYPLVSIGNMLILIGFLIYEFFFKN